MSRRSLRLVAVFTLMAYLLANTHLNVAFAICASLRTAPKSAVQQGAKPETPRTTCKHCAKKAGSLGEASPGSEKPKQHDPSCPGCPDCSHGHSCPTCPCCPSDGKDCPIPGGCAMCS